METSIKVREEGVAQKDPSLAVLILSLQVSSSVQKAMRPTMGLLEEGFVPEKVAVVVLDESGGINVPSLST